MPSGPYSASVAARMGSSWRSTRNWHRWKPPPTVFSWPVPARDPRIFPTAWPRAVRLLRLRCPCWITAGWNWNLSPLSSRLKNVAPAALARGCAHTAQVRRWNGRANWWRRSTKCYAKAAEPAWQPARLARQRNMGLPTIRYWQRSRGFWILQRQSADSPKRMWFPSGRRHESFQDQDRCVPVSYTHLRAHETVLDL